MGRVHAEVGEHRAAGLAHHRTGHRVSRRVRRGVDQHDQRRGRCERAQEGEDRKSTRLNSSHLVISYAVFCLKKKTRVVLRKAALTRTSIAKRKASLRNIYFLVRTVARRATTSPTASYPSSSRTHVVDLSVIA